MAIYGYHRTSTTDQNLDRGIHEIQRFCEGRRMELLHIFTDQQTGKNFDRPDYQFLRKRILAGDTLIITELDRLGRNKAQILEELRYFKEKGVQVMILEIPTTTNDYSVFGDGLASKLVETVFDMLIQMFAVFAEAEIDKREKRQREGIEAKRRRGDWDFGRPQKVTEQDFLAVYNSEGSVASKCKKLGIAKTTYYQYKQRYVKQIPEAASTQV